MFVCVTFLVTTCTISVKGWNGKCMWHGHDSLWL